MLAEAKKRTSIALYKDILKLPRGHEVLLDVRNRIMDAADGGGQYVYLESSWVPEVMQLILARYLQCEGFEVVALTFKQRTGLVPAFKVSWLPEVQTRG